MSTLVTSDYEVSARQNELIQMLPKAELHVHLEGSIRRKTVKDLVEQHVTNQNLAQRINILALPGIHNQIEFERVYEQTEFKNLKDFMGRLDVNVAVLRRPEDFTRVVRELVYDASVQNIRYMEVTFSAGLHINDKTKQISSFKQLMNALDEGVMQANNEIVHESSDKHQVEVRFIIDHDRNFLNYEGPDQRQRSYNEYQQILEWCREERDNKHQESSIVGVGLGGEEAEDNMLSAFSSIVAQAKKYNIPFIPHAGEIKLAGNSEDTISIVRDYQIKRIGHGVYMTEVIDDLLNEQIVLEICPSSNLLTNSSPSIEEHPLRILWDAGVLITINTDDPGIFQKNLVDEYKLAMKRFQLTIGDLARASLTALRASFLQEDKRRAMEASFLEEFEKLGIQITDEIIPLNRRLLIPIAK
ncbi:adenosine deaminase [Dictyobacter alpinus]|uniref:adenosine deaminase n=1 Tax=Dictyobacter alpinus TaxID=2014873 RepID=A0A402B581_9CHLR|nr:adenosine deaminase family protein [Dictyobacter alpinus]GCE26508.1 adenosine deaminase [Dictyobacter alpinus]